MGDQPDRFCRLANLHGNDSQAMKGINILWLFRQQGPIGLFSLLQASRTVVFNGFLKRKIQHGGQPLYRAARGGSRIGCTDGTAAVGYLLRLFLCATQAQTAVVVPFPKIEP